MSTVHGRIEFFDPERIVAPRGALEDVLGYPKYTVDPYIRILPGEQIDFLYRIANCHHRGQFGVLQFECHMPGGVLFHIDLYRWFGDINDPQLSFISNIYTGDFPTFTPENRELFWAAIGMFLADTLDVEHGSPVATPMIRFRVDDDPAYVPGEMWFASAAMTISTDDEWWSPGPTDVALAPGSGCVNSVQLPPNSLIQFGMHNDSMMTTGISGNTRPLVVLMNNVPGVGSFELYGGNGNLAISKPLTGGSVEMSQHLPEFWRLGIPSDGEFHTFNMRAKYSTGSSFNGYFCEISIDVGRGFDGLWVDAAARTRWVALSPQLLAGGYLLPQPAIWQLRPGSAYCLSPDESECGGEEVPVPITGSDPSELANLVSDYPDDSASHYEWKPPGEIILYNDPAPVGDYTFRGYFENLGEVDLDSVRLQIGGSSTIFTIPLGGPHLIEVPFTAVEDDWTDVGISARDEGKVYIYSIQVAAAAAGGDCDYLLPEVPVFEWLRSTADIVPPVITLSPAEAGVKWRAWPVFLNVTQELEPEEAPIYYTAVDPVQLYVPPIELSPDEAAGFRWYALDAALLPDAIYLAPDAPVYEYEPIDPDGLYVGQPPDLELRAEPSQFRYYALDPTVDFEHTTAMPLQPGRARIDMWPAPYGVALAISANILPPPPGKGLGYEVVALSSLFTMEVTADSLVPPKWSTIYGSGRGSIRR